MEWYQSGKKRSEGWYISKGINDRYGKYISWYENGQKNVELTYNNYGRLDGKWTSWYENGQKKREGIFKDHSRVGKWTDFNENGTVKEVRDCDKVDCY